MVSVDVKQHWIKKTPRLSVLVDRFGVPLARRSMESVPGWQLILSMRARETRERESREVFWWDLARVLQSGLCCSCSSTDGSWVGWDGGMVGRVFSWCSFNKGDLNRRCLTDHIHRLDFIFYFIDVQHQHTRELINARNTQHKYSNKGLSRLQVTLTWHACKYKVHKLH